MFSHLCRKEPFRKTQTRISQSIKEGYNEHSSWEDAMDKNFENVTLFVRMKKDMREQNMHVSTFGD